MLKHGFFNRRSAEIAKSKSEDERMAALLDSPMIDKLIQNRDAELLKTRHRHAADLAVLDAREHDERLAMTERLGSAMNEVNKAMAETERLREILRAMLCEEAGLWATFHTARAFHENELRLSAPLIGDAIQDLIDLSQKYQRPRDTRFLPCIDKALQALKQLQLEPDHTKFPEIIDRIMATIPNPEGEPPQGGMINAVTGNVIPPRGGL